MVSDASGIFRNITDPEALDAAIRLTGMIQWFDDGINVDLAYDLTSIEYAISSEVPRTARRPRWSLLRLDEEIGCGSTMYEVTRQTINGDGRYV